MPISPSGVHLAGGQGRSPSRTGGWSGRAGGPARAAAGTRISSVAGARHRPGRRHGIAHRGGPVPAGTAAQCRAARLREDRYAGVRLAQLSISACCLRFHLITPRLARWLLTSVDRADGHRVHVTHEELAQRLGIRRVGVTTAASGLRRAGLIAYHRGELIVLDRPGLQAVACSCYEADRAVYAQALGPVRSPLKLSVTQNLRNSWCAAILAEGADQ